MLIKIEKETNEIVKNERPEAEKLNMTNDVWLEKVKTSFDF